MHTYTCSNSGLNCVDYVGIHVWFIFGLIGWFALFLQVFPILQEGKTSFCSKVRNTINRRKKSNQKTKNKTKQKDTKDEIVHMMESC